MRNKLFLLVLVLLLFPFAFAYDISISAPTEVWESFTATVEISDVTDLDVAEITIEYDEEILSFDDATLGSFVSAGQITKTNDQIEIDMGGTGVSGSGELAELQFTVKKEVWDYSPITLPNVVIYNTASQELTQGTTSITSIEVEYVEPAEDPEEETPPSPTTPAAGGGGGGGGGGGIGTTTSNGTISSGEGEGSGISTQTGGSDETTGADDEKIESRGVFNAEKRRAMSESIKNFFHNLATRFRAFFFR